MILLRVVVLILTAILVTTGLILAVVALLAAQWLAVAAVVLVVMAFVWAALKGIALIRARFSGSEKGGPPQGEEGSVRGLPPRPHQRASSGRRISNGTDVEP